ncbi:killer cell lectin receptor subfamily F member 1 [Biomphalaria glabrata]|nr:killer cell lectin receptor subfamily F member 1 [Biomphalaria glabrata]
MVINWLGQVRLVCTELKLSFFHKRENTLPVSQSTVTTVQARSVLDCALTCLSTNCTSFSFDDQQDTCDIGNITVSNVATSPLTNMYISCNANDGFKLLIKGSVIACVYLSNNQVDYISARENCKAMSSHLLTVKTLDKLQMLQDNYKSIKQIWIGLNDIEVENVFRWEDDNSVCDTTCRPMVFESDKPDDYGGNEDCVIFNFDVETKLNDFPCQLNLRFLCEKPFFNKP